MQSEQRLKENVVNQKWVKVMKRGQKQEVNFRLQSGEFKTSLFFLPLFHVNVMQGGEVSVTTKG